MSMIDVFDFDRIVLVVMLKIWRCEVKHSHERPCHTYSGAYRLFMSVAKPCITSNNRMGDNRFLPVSDSCAAGSK